MSKDEERTVRVVERGELGHDATSGGEREDVEGEERPGTGSTCLCYLFFACCISTPGLIKLPVANVIGSTLSRPALGNVGHIQRIREESSSDSQKRLASATTTNEGDQGHAPVSGNVRVQGAFGAELLERPPHQPVMFSPDSRVCCRSSGRRRR